jgi:class 3 adenylate cyclase/tetratricopeptide (TPR) repeat protein
MPICPNCGQENPEGFRLCGMCGTPLTEPEAAHAARKTVTILFCDVAGYTSAGERLDPEALRNLQSRYFEVTRAALERHGGTVEKFIGDAVMAVFGIPQIHEDDALRAARAALELRAAVSELELETRIGVATGEVVAGSGEALVTGDTVNVAARLEQLAAPGDILIGEPTYRLVADAVSADASGPLEMKGKAEPVSAWRLLEVREGAQAVARQLDRPLVGRQHELQLLRDAYDRSVRDRTCHLVTVLGDPGVGKSRLVAEFLTGISLEATVARGRCLSYGQGITFWPLDEAIREALAADAHRLRSAIAAAVVEEPAQERVAALVAEALGLERGSATSEEMLWAFRRLFEALARRRPLVLVLDDIQWGEQTLLELIEHLADLTRDAPLLLVCMARPDLLDLRPAWGGGKLNATAFLLAPLVPDETRALIENLVGGDVPDAAVTQIASAAEGNALFAEEMLGMLIDDEVLVRQNGSWGLAGDLAAVPVPPTIRALLSARLDRLPESDRLVLERASVEGQVFHAGAVTELAQAETVPASLQSLVRREFVRPERPTFADEDAFRFRHLLIRDTAYESLPKVTRAALHERYASWLEAKAGEQAAEYAEILGYHLEQAHGYRVELSADDAHAPALALRAGHWLAEAGRRALAHGDVPAGASLLGRAVGLLPAADAERLELLPDLAAVLAESGRIDEARGLVREAAELARDSGDRGIEARAVLADMWWRLDMDAVAAADVEPAIAHAIETLEELGDEYGLATAWRTMGDVYNTLGETLEWIDALRRAFDYARRSGNRNEEIVCLAIYGGAMFFGPTPAGEAIERLERIQKEVAGDVLLESSLLRSLGGFIAVTGRIEEGRAAVRRAEEIMGEFGLQWQLAGATFITAEIEFIAGDTEAAEAEYRRGLDMYLRMGERGRASTLAVGVGICLYQRGLLDDAERMALEGAGLGSSDDVVTQGGADAVRAAVHARRGQLEEATALAARAWETIGGSAFLWASRSAELIADVHELAGRADEARRFREVALERYERKQNVVMAARMRELLARG